MTDSPPSMPILLDALPEGFRLELALRKLPPGDPARPETALRLAEHTRLLDPRRAATLAGEADAGGADSERCARVQAAALLEDAKPAEAAPWIARLSAGPWRELLEARRSLLAGGPEAALPALNHLVGDPGTPPAIRAEALSFRLRARAASGDAGAMGDLDALEQLCIQQKATLTGIWVGALKGVLKSTEAKDFARVMGAWEAAVLVAEAVGGVPLDAKKLGAMPPWVHGALLKHRTDPPRMMAILLPLTALLWRIGREEDAFRTVTLGAEAIRRVCGEEAAAPLVELRAALRIRAGEEKWAALESAVLAAADAGSQDPGI